MRIILSMLFVIALGGCVAVPVADNSYVSECELSTDMKTLKVINVAEESNSYYSVSGVILSPILIPATAILSGTYVVVNNTYHLGSEKLQCS